MAINHPAELPEGGEGGGSGPIRFRPGIGGPNELPQFEGGSYRSLVQEIFSLRDRVHALESNAVATRFAAFSRVSWPNELPEGGEGGGGGGIFHPPKEIAELPWDRQLVSQLAAVAERLSVLESKVLQSIQGLQARVDAISKK